MITISHQTIRKRSVKNRINRFFFQWYVVCVTFGPSIAAMCCRMHACIDTRTFNLPFSRWPFQQNSVHKLMTSLKTDLHAKHETMFGGAVICNLVVHLFIPIRIVLSLPTSTLRDPIWRAGLWLCFFFACLISLLLRGACLCATRCMHVSQRQSVVHVECRCT